jgi:single-stranded DNA-binding protein
MANSQKAHLEQRGKILGMEFPLPTQGYIVAIVAPPEYEDGETPRTRVRGAVEFYNRRTKQTESVYIGLTVFGSAASVINKYAEVGGQVFVRVNESLSIGVPQDDKLNESNQLYFDMSANDVRLLRSSNNGGSRSNGGNASASEDSGIEF